ncbi:MAG: LuxR C-terminal-related transcriptional regulator [Actinobacteria bacterium]|nr:LuxR C-terminal-related transcriptional regulator [Actinomycetota bacterium]
MRADGAASMRLVDQARARAGAAARLVVVAGAGAGKSALLDGLAARWSDDGRSVRRLAGRRLESDRPGWALDTVLDPDQVERLSEGHLAAERSALDRLREITGEGGVLLVDDAQWLDPCSLRLIAGAAERQAAVVLAARPSARADLAGLVGFLGDEGRMVTLAPLGVDEVAHLTEEVTGRRPDAALVTSLLARSAGIPGWVVRLLADGHDPDRATATPPLDPAGPLVAQVRTELEQLPHAARRVVVALGVIGVAGDGLLAEVVDLPPLQVAAATDQASAAGLVRPGSGELVGVVAEALAVIVPPPERHHLQTRLAEAAEGGSAAAKAAVVARLIADGATGAATARLLVAAAEEVAELDPEVASSWLVRAVELGADPASLALRRAELLAEQGDLGTALRLAAPIAAAEGRRCPAALVVTAAALVGRGLWARAAERYAALVDSGAPGHALLAVPLLVAGGRLEQAHEVDEAARAALPQPLPLPDEVLARCAEGMLASIHCPGEALDALLEAVELAEADPPSLLLPDSPHALAALVASASGDLVVARQLARRAVEAAVGGAALATRHRLLEAWMAMRAGGWAAAQEVLGDVAPSSRRDQLVSVALDAALARRTGDVGRLTAAWDRAQAMLLGWHPELGLLEPVGELAVAAARLGQWERMAAVARELGALLDRLGRPPLWDLLLRWYGLQAAIAADDGPAAVRRAEDIARIEPASRRLASLGGVARVWAASLEGRTDSGALRWAASELQALNLAWEGSRLLGAGAIRTTDPTETRALLEQARGLRDELGTTAPGALADVSALSEREAQVAEGVADGLTYKEIGERLYISPKTVEHHVARIRQKLGASTRAEMLAALRTSE